MLANANFAYPGTRAFSREDSSAFFGRRAEAMQLRANWLENRLTYLSGPAGVGKTSLLQAGVLPLMINSRVSLLSVGGFSMRTARPVTVLPKHNPYTLALLRSWSGGNESPDLAEITVAEFFARHAGRAGSDVTILAAIDQADDLFAVPRERQSSRHHLLSELAVALHEHPSVHLLVSGRPDTVGAFASVLGNGVELTLRPLTIPGARDAINGSGFFADDATELLVSALRTSRINRGPGTQRILFTRQIEPALLQAACGRIWESLRDNFPAITAKELEARRELSVDSALAGYCAAAIASIAMAYGFDAGQLRSWLIETFISRVGDLSTAADDQLGAAGPSLAIMRALEDSHVLRAGAGEHPGTRNYSLISDRLIEPLRHSPVETATPGNPDEYIAAAGRARIMGDRTLAGAFVERALAGASPTDIRLHAEAYTLLGDLAFEDAEWDRACRSYQNAEVMFGAVGDREGVAQTLYARAKTYIMLDELEEALACLRQAPQWTRKPILQLELSWLINTFAEQARQSTPFRTSTA